MLLHRVNNPKFDVEQIELKYFEPGYSFVASDSAHSRIEKQIRKMGKLCDFRDFLEATKSANCEPVEMSDLRNWTSGVSQYALKQLGEQRPYLNKIVCAKFCKGSEELIYQTAFDQTEISVQVLKTSVHLPSACSENHKNPRGIETGKKSEPIATVNTMYQIGIEIHETLLPRDKS